MEAGLGLSAAEDIHSQHDIAFAGSLPKLLLNLWDHFVADVRE